MEPTVRINCARREEDITGTGIETVTRSILTGANLASQIETNIAALDIVRIAYSSHNKIL